MYSNGSDRFADTLIDPLTGLYNREGFQRRLAEEYARARSLALPFSLVAFDLDCFAEINARFYVPGGDKVIAGIARLLSSFATSADLVARDGGDQFSLIMTGTNSDEASREAERLRLAIALNPIEVGSERVEVTASVGVSTATFEEVEPWDLFVRARDAVHRAKALGRNRVVVG